MKKSTLILAIAALAFASCRKTDGVAPVSSTPDVNTVASKHGGADDNINHDANDDNLPKHSGADDGVKHDANDDNLPKHSGKDDRNITVPTKVTAAFNKLYPGSVIREWKLTSDGLYKAHFTRKGVAYEASFKANGTLVKIERDK
ncbi:hypothetical protein SNE25_19790 [Mucilaginibacter sabulilitoris]|uniref:Beta-lactamase-inhibitor-like PepSY-like domain-containing protein n=1 Tax=Mucilaginibacter sabulilitoris TaxID=1173583 RepID=A0ABZ0TFI2_9SPHI|nr:hypothetical protein [Mucilaginibacter sabulilitoris]WPU91561.1 hypothetical protein SNE25_19790 [Mucilaginibacter sabulilitoris]